ncbi:MAG: phosphatidate cytidylyltransferase [Jatrophihabitans sp.]
MAADDPADPGAPAALPADAGPGAADATSSALSRARRVAGLAKTHPEAAAPPRDRSPASKSARPAPPPGGAPAGATWVLEPPTSTAFGEQPRQDVDDPAAAPQRKSKAGRNLPAAIAVGAGLGGLIAASLFLYRPSFAYIVGMALVYGCWELAQALKKATIRITLVPLVVGGVATLVAAWQRGPSGLVLAVLVTLLGVFIWRVADGAHGYTRDTAASALILLYVPTLAGFAILLAHPSDGAARVLAFVATVVCSDVGGYVTGVLVGRHPLAPVISKAKTWEGFAGSVLACSAAGILFMTLTFHEAWWKGLLFGLAIVVTATLGDLGASMIKRDVGVKDYGKLLPGHGGLMDRLDSLLPCAAVAYLLLSGFAPL